MQKPMVTSLSNPLVKQARALRLRKERLESGLFLIEGIHPVGEALEAKWEIEAVLFAPELLTSSFARDLLSRLTFAPQPVSASVMESLADKENPQGILAVARQKKSTIAELGEIKKAVALVSPQDPGNVGTILRTMDAVGVDTLFLLDGGVELYHPTVIRASMGAIFWESVVQTSFAEFMNWARAKGCQLIGTSAHAGMDLHSRAPKSPWILLMGNEQKGLSPEQINACDLTVSLPMRGRASSLNLAVAAGILLYSLTDK